MLQSSVLVVHCFGLGYWLFSRCNFGVIDVGIFVLCLVRFLSFFGLFLGLCSFFYLLILGMCCFGIMSLWYCILVVQHAKCCCCCLWGSCLCVFHLVLLLFLGSCSVCLFLGCVVLVVHHFILLIGCSAWEPFMSLFWEFSFAFIWSLFCLFVFWMHCFGSLSFL